ncbi:MAG TPA: TetR-like C-terminal domain-containing protein, partial [Mycobacteriales bacterium]|nr:TetR-like C-terminal domain-containing protein [Mycobacteriales bacterium]
CIDRAVERGEITAALDLSLLGDLIEGPLMHRRMVGRQPLTSEFLDAIAAIAYRVMTAAETRR